MKFSIIVSILFLSVGSAIAASTDQVRIKAGDMTVSRYVEQLSDQTGIVISDGTGEAGPMLSIPDLGPVSREEAINQAQTKLTGVGYTLVYDKKNDFYRLLRQRDARDQSIPFVSDPAQVAQLEDSDRLVTAVIRLKHIDPEIVARNIRSFAPANARIIPDGFNRLLLITDSARSMKKYRGIADSLDTPKAAEDFRDYLKSRSKAEAEACAGENGGRSIWNLPGPTSNAGIALFAMLGLIVGFIIRGYVIRRIEGGL